jgi:integrase
MTMRIDTVSGRKKLTPRRDPYWSKTAQGVHIGFRKMAEGSAGTWSVRILDQTKQRVTRSLGDLGHLPDHERYEAARKEALTLAEHIAKGGLSASKTVADCCKAYVDHLRERRGDKAADDADRRFKQYVLDDPVFAAMELTKLTPAHIEAWRKRLKDRPVGKEKKKVRTLSSLNRDVTPFRAALNLAYDDGWCVTDFAWRKKLRPLAGVDSKRDLYLTKDERKALIENADPDLARFLRGLATLPIRPGALAELKVKDFDPRRNQLQIPVDKTGGRMITLPASTAEMLADCCKGRKADEPLFIRENGSKWGKDSWKVGVRDAVAAAGLNEKVTAYTLRHSVITDLVHVGLDLLTVAQLSGTSIRMIEQHYGHLRNEVASEALQAIAV